MKFFFIFFILALLFKFLDLNLALLPIGNLVTLFCFQLQKFISKILGTPLRNFCVLADMT